MEFSVRVHTSPGDATTFDLNTFAPDADDDGRARDFGHSIIEGGVFVGDDAEIRYVASLIEHAPDLENLLRLIVAGQQDRDKLIERAARVLRAIDDRETNYRMEL